MRGSDSLSAKPWFFLLKQELVVWGRTQGSRWVFVVKAVLAALVAMGLSMLFQLDQPRLAMITVFIVMRPQTGMILTKSLYRIGGTVAGIMVSFLLVSCFAQERVLFLLGLAFWVGICTAGAAFYRDFKSYGFVLAGYVAALAGLQAAPQPLSFFSLAVTRLSEVSLGIICAGVINDVIFPQRLSDQIFGNVQNRYADFIAFVHKSLSGTATPTQLANMQLKLVGDVVALESIRSAAILEDPEVRARDRKIQSLNSKFMAASTTFYSFHQLLERLTRNSTSAGEACVSPDCQRSLLTSRRTTPLPPPRPPRPRLARRASGFPANCPPVPRSTAGRVRATSQRSRVGLLPCGRASAVRPVF